MHVYVQKGEALLVVNICEPSFIETRGRLHQEKVNLAVDHRLGTYAKNNYLTNVSKRQPMVAHVTKRRSMLAQELRAHFG